MLTPWLSCKSAKNGIKLLLYVRDSPRLAFKRDRRILIRKIIPLDIGYGLVCPKYHCIGVTDALDFSVMTQSRTDVRTTSSKQGITAKDFGKLSGSFNVSFIVAI